MKKLIATFLLTLALPALAALEAAGVKFDDKMKVGAGDTVINGVGVRGVLFIKGYAMALYLPQKTAAAGEAISAKGAKRVRIVLLRDTSGETFADALPSGIRKNHSEQEVAPLNARIEALKATMLTITTAPKGARAGPRARGMQFLRYRFCRYRWSRWRAFCGAWGAGRANRRALAVRGGSARATVGGVHRWRAAV